MMSSSTKAQSKQLLGVHAALRSKKPLTPQTLLEMSEMALYDKVDRRAQQSQPVLGQPFRLLPTAATYILMQEFRP
jgi:hypothetical protein